jgi:LysR family transcriptional regulator, transcriptional activator of the cysJI operon
MELNLTAMRTLLEVATRGSFSKAAQSLHLTQPAVSLQIQNLENFFRTTLLLRGPAGKVELTADGKILCEYAAKLVDLQQDLFVKMEHSMGDTFQRVRLGACVIAGEHLFPPVVKAFVEKYPEIRLSMSILKCNRIFEGLLSAVYDIGITGTPPSSKLLAFEEIFRVPVEIFEAKVGDNGPREISLLELAAKPLIIREEGSGIWNEFVRFLKVHDRKLKEFNTISVSESNEAIKTLVKSGAGFSMFPRFMVEKEFENGELIKIRLKEGRMKQSFYIVYRKKLPLSKPIREFFEFTSRQMNLILTHTHQVQAA